MQIGSIFKDRYRIIKKIGSGGMGAVFLAENINLENSYWAIKQIKKEVGSTIDIKDEQKILTKLNHPSIIKIFDVLEDYNYIYLIEEYVDGWNLLEILKTNERIAEDVVIEWTKQILEALNYLHTRKPHPIIYRDLKLSNIMLDSEGRIKIIDFGIAKQQIVGEVQNGPNLGSKIYAAPEQLSSGQTDARTDIYSLGVILYALVIGTGAKISAGNMTPIRQIDPNLSIGLEKIITKCLYVNPQQRYQSVKEIFKDISTMYKFDHRYKALIKSKYIAISIALVCICSSTVLLLAGINQLGKEKIEKYNAIISQGEILAQNGDYEEALETFNEAIAIIPKDVAAYKAIGEMYYNSGEYDKCISYFEKNALLKEPSLYEDADTLYIIGSAYFKEENYTKACKWIEKALVVSPNTVHFLRDLSVSYAKDGDLDKAKEILNKLKHEKTQEDVTLYVNGEILLKEGNIKEALEFFENSFNITKNEEIKIKSIISMAELYRDNRSTLGNTAIDNEIEILEKATEVLTENNNLVITEMLARAYYDKANLSSSKEYYEKSIETFNKLLSLGYRRPYIYKNIAIIYQQQLKSYSKAEEILLEMKEIYPQESSCYAQLTLLYIEIENNKPEKARDYQKAYDCYLEAIKYDSEGSNNVSLQQIESLINELENKGWLN